MAHGEVTREIAAARQDILASGDELVAEHPEVGAVVLERTNMVPFARALRQRLQMPVYDTYGFVTWFHAGLSPRGLACPAIPWSGPVEGALPGPRRQSEAVAAIPSLARRP